ncbi:MAG: hypothetical protein IK079_00475, partial [Desulfovibrio sp.]|nr:hypothetical protein [Desulfovibrio sp.]
MWRFLCVSCKVLGALCSVLLIILLGFFLWLSSNKDWVKNKLVLGVEEALGQPCHVENARVRFSPWPVLYVESVQSTGSHMQFSASQFVFSPSLPHLFLGQIIPSYLYLKDPLFSIQKMHWQKSEKPISLDLPKGITLHIENGRVLIQENNQSLSFEGLDCFLQTGFDKRVRGDVSVRYGMFVMGKTKFFLADLLWMGDMGVGNFFAKESEFVLRCDLANDSSHTRAVLQFKGKRVDEAWRVQTKCIGALTQDTARIPFFLKGTVNLPDALKTIQLQHLNLGLGDRDSGVLNATYTIAERSLDGEFSFKRISLT